MAEKTEETTGRYADILKSMSLIGASQLVSIVLSVVRLKVLAVLLGPVGIGLFGLYNVILDLAASIAGLGVQSSGVRQVAVAVATGDAKRIATIARVLNRSSFILGLVGALGLLALAAPVATLTFGDAVRAPAVALLGFALFLRIVAGAPVAIIQGTRRMGDLARLTVLGAVLNTIASIPLVYFLGEAGVVPSLIAVALTSWIAANWYGRRLDLPQIKVTLGTFGSETRMLLGLGFAFMASALLTSGAAFVIRIIVVQHSGVDAAGNYQAAWALGGIYVGFILQAMGTDFYPRLSALVTDHVASNRLVNEQARISMLLAAPGLLATLALSPLIIVMFYSTQFADSIPVLRWLCVGMLLRVMAWPMGYLILAQGRQQIFFWTEVAATIVHVGLAYMLVGALGVSGAGLAFVGLYLWHGAVILILVKRLTGFTWSADNLLLAGVFSALAAVELVAVQFLEAGPALAVGVAVTVIASWFSATQLVRLVPQNWIPAGMRPLVHRLLLHRPAIA